MDCRDTLVNIFENLFFSSHNVLYAFLKLGYFLDIAIIHKRIHMTYIQMFSALQKLMHNKAILPYQATQNVQAAKHTLWISTFWASLN